MTIFKSTNLFMPTCWISIWRISMCLACYIHVCEVVHVSTMLCKKHTLYYSACYTHAVLQGMYNVHPIHVVL